MLVQGVGAAAARSRGIWLEPKSGHFGSAPAPVPAPVPALASVPAPASILAS